MNRAESKCLKSKLVIPNSFLVETTRFVICTKLNEKDFLTFKYNHLKFRVFFTRFRTIFQVDEICNFYREQWLVFFEQLYVNGACVPCVVLWVWHFIDLFHIKEVSLLSIFIEISIFNVMHKCLFEFQLLTKIFLWISCI